MMRKASLAGRVIASALQTIRDFVPNLEERLDDMRWFLPNGLGIKRPPVFKHFGNIPHDDRKIRSDACGKYRAPRVASV